MDDSPLTQRQSEHYGELIGGKFLVQRVLGEGGVGVVLEGRHNELGNRVAIKIAHAGDREAFAVFLRNARAMARLKGPHTVRILEVGETRGPAGLPWVAMEYLKGQDLGSMLAERGPLSVDDALRWAMEVCEALSEAHDIGLVHRAVKPKNLFLAVDGATSAIRVLDFGLSLFPTVVSNGNAVSVPPADPSDPVTEPRGRARAGDDDDDESKTAFFDRAPERPTRPTGFGPHLLEAYQYLSPEQLRDGEVDARTDVWGVGACLFRLLTGAHAFGGKTTAEVMDNILNQTPIEIRAFRGDIPSGLDGVVKQCLRRAARNRFQSMESLAIALRGARAEARETPKVVLAMGKLTSDEAPLTPLVPTSLVHTPPVPTPIEAWSEAKVEARAAIPAAWKGSDAPAAPLLRQQPSILQQLIDDSPPILRLPDGSRAKAPGRGEAPRALAFGDAPPQKRELPPPQILPAYAAPAPNTQQMPPMASPLDGSRTVVKITDGMPAHAAGPINLPAAEAAKGPDTIQDLQAIPPNPDVPRVFNSPPADRGNRANPDVFSFGAGFAQQAPSTPVHRAELSFRSPTAPLRSPVSAPVSAPVSSMVAFMPDGAQAPPYALRPPSSRAASVGFGLVLAALALGSVGLLYSSSVKWPLRSTPVEAEPATEGTAPTPPSVVPPATSSAAATSTQTGGPVSLVPASGAGAGSVTSAAVPAPSAGAPVEVPPDKPTASPPEKPPANPPERAEKPPGPRVTPAPPSTPQPTRRKPAPPSPAAGAGTGAGGGDEPVPSIFDKRK